MVTKRETHEHIREESRRGSRDQQHRTHRTNNREEKVKNNTRRNKAETTTNNNTGLQKKAKHVKNTELIESARIPKESNNERKNRSPRKKSAVMRNTITRNDKKKSDPLKNIVVGISVNKREYDYDDQFQNETYEQNSFVSSVSSVTNTIAFGNESILGNTIDIQQENRKSKKYASYDNGNCDVSELSASVVDKRVRTSQKKKKYYPRLPSIISRQDSDSESNNSHDERFDYDEHDDHDDYESDLYMNDSNRSPHERKRKRKSQKKIKNKKVRRKFLLITSCMACIPILSALCFIVIWYFSEYVPATELAYLQATSHPPTQVPSSWPSDIPSILPSIQPSTLSSVYPSLLPSILPSVYPSLLPSILPSQYQSQLPTGIFSFAPSAFPSYHPSSNPSQRPSAIPTQSPSKHPTKNPTKSPSQKPTKQPTSKPTQKATLGPTLSHKPTFHPTTSKPSKRPTPNPTPKPTQTPSISFIPTLQPTAPTLSLSEPFSFLVVGDVPYDEEEIDIFRSQVSSISSTNEFIVHVGDMTRASYTQCSPSDYETVDSILQQSSIPVFIVLGDNDYMDCPNPYFALTRWKLHFAQYHMKYDWEPNSVNGHKFLSLVEYQSRRNENMVFFRKGILFLFLHIVGEPLQGLGSWPEAEFAARHSDNLSFTKSNLSKYRRDENLRGVVIFGHAKPRRSLHSDFFDPLLQYVNNFRQFRSIPFLYLHGDGHDYEESYDFNTDSGITLSNFKRIQVEQGANEGPLRVHVSPNRAITEDVFDGSVVSVNSNDAYFSVERGIRY